MVKIHIVNIIYTSWIVLKCVMPPSTLQSEIPKIIEANQDNFALNHFTSLIFQQTLHTNQLGELFHRFSLKTLRLQRPQGPVST